MSSTTPWHEAGIWAAPLLLLASAFFTGHGKAYAEQAPESTDVKTEARFKKTKSTKNNTGGDRVIKLKEVTVLGKERGSSLVGEAQSASQGFIGQEQIKNRPLSRVGELVEFIPGMIATQHSGDGKANQYFLRGFNLDHGTDFATFVDGVPINLPSHAHGQGYMDLNGLIPELIDHIQYGKGPYYADQGDFSAAGHAKMATFNSLLRGFAKFTGGSFGFYRGVAANSNRIGEGNLLYAGDVNTYDGPWALAEHALKFNGMLKYSFDKGNWGGSMGIKAYHANWRPTNQIPLFAVQEGLISRFGNIDPTDNGKTGRYTLHADWWQKENNYRREASFYLVKYDIDLTSNFSGFINSVADNTVLPGGIIPSDQMNQRESRIYFGGKAEQSWFNKVAGFAMENSLGVQVRTDLNHVLLNNSNRGAVYRNVSNDRVTETSMGVYLQNRTYWLPKLRTIAGLRGDIFNFDVHATTVPQNSGNKIASLASPKLSVVLGPWHDTEFYLSAGGGYHSNDARGVTATVNTNQVGGNNFAPQLGADGLVRAWGGEAGLRTEAIDGLKSTLAIWYLHSASELVFSGDTGTTEASGASTRYGIEWANFYKPAKWLTLDADFAFTRARYDRPQLNQASDPVNQAYGFHIPNAVGRTISAGATVNLPYNFFATLRLRHFGNVTVDTNNPVPPYSTTIVNLSAGYEIVKKLKVQLDVLNLLNANSFDIAYYYGYQTSPAAKARDGLVFHPIEPRMFRATLAYQF
jgi:outer membrane receptor protein involved in Fe transport